MRAHIPVPKFIGVILAGVVVAIGGRAAAHCDTMDGPVVGAAKAALAAGDVTPSLRWVGAADESEVRAAFDRAVAVRAAGGPAKDLADLYFFETIVRLHRGSEGVPYTGLKPSGAPVEPSIAAADAALEGGSVDDLAKLLGEAMTRGLRERFRHAHEKRRHADDSVAAGREAVAAYVRFTHYAERVHAMAAAPLHADEADDAHQHTSIAPQNAVPQGRTPMRASRWPVASAGVAAAVALLARRSWFMRRRPS